MKTYSFFFVFVLQLNLSFLFAQEGTNGLNKNVLLGISKVGVLQETENFVSQPTVVPFQDGFLSVELSNPQKGCIHYINTLTDKSVAIPLKPLFDALGKGKKDMVYLACLASSNDVIYFVDFEWIVAAKVINNELQIINSVDLSLNVTPRVATVYNNKLYFVGHVQYKNEYVVWSCDAESLTLLEEKILPDQQAGFCWCQPSQRYTAWHNGQFLFADCTNYLIRSYSCERHEYDTLIHEQWNTLFPSDFSFEIQDKGKSNCQRLSDTRHEFVNGVTSIGNDTLVVSIWEGFRPKRMDTFVVKNGKWSMSNTSDIIFETFKENGNAENYVRSNAGINVMGFYQNGYLYFVFHGPKELPNEESYNEFQERLYKYLKRKKAIIYLSKWKVDY
jgi:hypothetical protein